MYFILLVRHLVEWRLFFVNGFVSAYVGGPMKCGQNHVVRGGSWTGHPGVPMYGIYRFIGFGLHKRNDL